jgi:hypothetical protein
MPPASGWVSWVQVEAFTWPKIQSEQTNSTTRCDHHLNRAKACSFCHFKTNSDILFLFKCVWAIHMRGSRAPCRPSWEQLISNKETPCNLNTQRLTNCDKIHWLSYRHSSQVNGCRRGCTISMRYGCHRYCTIHHIYSEHSYRRCIRL